MELLFADWRLQHTLESRVSVDDRFGESDGALVRQRICELIAADNLAVAAVVPTLDLRALDSAVGTFSVELTPRFRLRFDIASESVPRAAGDGQIDLSEVGAVRIVAVEEI
jgi:hypothetical protein